MKKKQLLSIFAAFALAAQSAAAATHTAVKGDTYWLIAQRYGVSLSDLLKANNADESTVLNIGDKVIVPTVHTVKKGDTYWLIAQQYGVGLSDLLKANGANEGTVLNIGDKVIVPDSSSSTYIAKKGDSFWSISQKYGVSLAALLKANGADESTVLNIGDKVIIPSGSSGGTPSGGTASGGTSSGVTSSGAYITYKTYTVKSGDTLWSIAVSCGIPMSELLSANGLTESSTVRAGQQLTVPVHNVPVKPTVSDAHGELLDWWSEAQYVIPIGAEFTVKDFSTGRTFRAKRTVGSNHADCEPLTAADAAAMKSIWGGSYSWDKRPVLIIYNGRKIAASAAGMPHAGNEWAAAGVWTDWRSDNYGAGINYDYVKGNDFSGHFDIHFYNSTTHNTGAPSAAHQANVKTAAGLA